MKRKEVSRKEVSKKQVSTRILGRRLARELTDAELMAITGGATSCSAVCDDCVEM